MKAGQLGGGGESLPSGLHKEAVVQALEQVGSFFGGRRGRRILFVLGAVMVLSPLLRFIEFARAGMIQLSAPNLATFLGGVMAIYLAFQEAEGGPAWP